MRFNQTDVSDEKWERDRKLFIECFYGEKTFVSLKDNKNFCKTNLIRAVSVIENQYPIDGKIDFRITIIQSKIIQGLEKLNDLGAGVFMMINEGDGKGRKTENVIKVRAIFGDFDDPTKALPNFNLEPSLIVESSKKKYHVYWLSDNIPLECFRQLQEGIILKYGCDPAVKNLNRTLRFPGFFHNKKKRFMSQIVHYTGNKYDFGMLSEEFPPPPRKQFSAPQFKKDLYADKKEFTGTRGASKGGRNAHVIKRIGGMVNRGLNYSEIESEVYLEAEACNPKLGQSDINNLLYSAKRYF